MKLVIEDEAGTKSTVPFAGTEITVGRGSEGITFRLPDRNVSRRHARLENLLERQPELLPLPGQRQPVVLVVTRAHPPSQEHLGEIRIALAVGAEDDLHRALEPDRRGIAAARDAGDGGHDGREALLEHLKARGGRLNS